MLTVTYMQSVKASIDALVFRYLFASDVSQCLSFIPEMLQDRKLYGILYLRLDGVQDLSLKPNSRVVADIIMLNKYQLSDIRHIG